MSIFGRGFGGGTTVASKVPFPPNLAGATATLNGTPLALYFVAPNQINAALPLDAAAGTVRVTTAHGFAETQLDLFDTAPAIFPNAITHANGTLVSAASPAAPGETLVIYMTGLGQVDGRLDTGQPAPSSPLLRVTTPVEVQIGDVSVPAGFAGLSPGLVAVYQVNVAVPSNLTPKTYPIRVSVKGNASAPQSIPVQNRNP